MQEKGEKSPSVAYQPVLLVIRAEQALPSIWNLFEITGVLLSSAHCTLRRNGNQVGESPEEMAENDQRLKILSFSKT